MNNLKLIFFSISVIILISVSPSAVSAENVPAWIKNNALWYGQGDITETEFLNSIKFLIENNILVLENDEPIICIVILL